MGNLVRSLRTRWIIIGEVRAHTTLLRAGGCHCGWWINWRGYWDRFQGCEFLLIDRLQAAVERRLAEAGLKLLALASRREDRRREFVPLWAEVGRKANYEYQ